MLWCGNCLSALQQLHMTSSEIRFGARIRKMCEAKSAAMLNLEIQSKDIMQHRCHSRPQNHRLIMTQALNQTLTALPIPWLSSPPLYSSKALVILAGHQPKDISTHTHTPAHTVRVHASAYDSWTAQQPKRKDRCVCTSLL